MLKRSLKFAALLFLLVIVSAQSQELFLSFFVLFPLLLLSIFMILEDESPKMLQMAIGIIGIFYFYYVIHRPSPELAMLGGLTVLIGGLTFFYRRHWDQKVKTESHLCQNAAQALETLKVKYQSRLESLHHLEKQVAGLLDLFEIAKDFNDTMSLEGIAAILQERVQPELQFQKMYLVLAGESEQAALGRTLCILENGVDERPQPELLSEAKKRSIEKVRESKKLLQEDGSLTFPITIDGEIAAYLNVEGVQGDDLAKFEVLAAYLALQIKKVSLYETVRELSIQDGLTGVFVRRHFMERFEEELKRSMKYQLPLAVLMLDIDHFKRYNDTYGHLAGDATLKQVAELLRQSLRRVDIVARYGGEEFIIVTPETKKEAVMEVAERIRSNIARHNFRIYNDQTRVTVSMGVALFPNDVSHGAASPESTHLAQGLIQKADKALYRAKDEGRNRVVLYQETP